jgi:hypothetical protein
MNGEVKAGDRVRPIAVSFRQSPGAIIVSFDSAI